MPRPLFPLRPAFRANNQPPLLNPRPFVLQCENLKTSSSLAKHFPTLASLFRLLSSLRLTIFLLVCSMALVFFATLDQTHWGVWFVQKEYFESWLAFWPLGRESTPGLPLPGGFLIGTLLLLNLFCGGLRFFRSSWEKIGIAFIHLGVLLLVLGGFATAMLQEESQMEIPTGESRNYTTNFRHHEIVVIDHSAADHDQVAAIPESLITKHGENQFPIPGTPFTLRVLRYWPNASLGTIDQNPSATPVAADSGVATTTPLAVFPSEPTHKPNEVNRAAALVSLESTNGTLGTWLVANTLTEMFPPQTFSFEGKSYSLALRLERHHLPFSLHLDQFTHEYYPGTRIPKNFASTVHIQEPGQGERTAVIRMNDPLRHRGLTFFQSQFKSGNGPDITILQVVRNPGRLLPYIAIYCVGVGMLLQFSLSFAKYLSRLRPGKNTAALALLAAISLGISSSPSELSADTAGTFAGFPVQYGGRFQPVDTLARNSLLILRGKQGVAFSPEETLAFGQKPSTWTAEEKARLAAAGIAFSPEVLAALEKRPVPLKMRFGRGSLSPDAWLLELAFRPQIAAHFKVFRIDNHEVQALLGVMPGETNSFSWAQILPALPTIDPAAREASQKENALRTPFERGLVKLAAAADTYHMLTVTFAPGDLPSGILPIQEYMAWLSSLQLAAAEVEKNKSSDGSTRFDEKLQQELQAFIIRYQSMAHEGRVGIVPPRTAEEIAHNKWANLGETLLNVTDNQPLDHPPVLPLLADLFAAYQAADPVGEARAVAGLQAMYGAMENLPRAQLQAEHVFNRIEPFYKTLCLYVLAFFLVCLGWVFRSQHPLRWAGWLIIFSFALHTLALLARMWIQGRPPVTNLYSSAVFVAWGAVLIGILIERFLKNGVGSAAAALIGFGSLIIAHHLAMSGDTLEMMQAVLDDNFWLATHVVTITFGYSAMFLAGLLGALHLILTTFTNRLDAPARRSLSQIVYGVVCFATLFSFVGTLLGGVWADQSWGRFWGWDPKENGALLIVLWCAIFLHARWGKLVGEIGLMQLAVFGNVITAASWFGTNLLGVGLHSYGFTEKGFFWLSLFWSSQLLILALGWLPKHHRGTKEKTRNI